MSLGYGNLIKRVLTTIGESDPTKPTYLSQLFHRRRYRALVAIIRTLSKGYVKSMLDAGCGKGLLYRVLIESGISVDTYICLDVDRSKLVEAEGHLVYADAQSMPIAPCSVDYSVASEVLEHLERPLIALRSLFLATRRYLIITFPDELVKDSLGFKYPEHIARINIHEVSLLAKRYGFEGILRYRLNYVVPPSAYDKFLPYSEGILRFLEGFQKTMKWVGPLSMIKTEIVAFKRLEECSTTLLVR